MEKGGKPPFIDGWRWTHESMCSPSHPLDQIAIRSMEHIIWTCACLHGGMLEVGGEMGRLTNLGGSTNPLSALWAHPLGVVGSHLV